MPDWGRIPEYKASLEAVLGAETRSLEGIVTPKLPELRSSAERLNDNLFALLKVK